MGRHPPPKWYEASFLHYFERNHQFRHTNEYDNVEVVKRGRRDALVNKHYKHKDYFYISFDNTISTRTYEYTYIHTYGYTHIYLVLCILTSLHTKIIYFSHTYVHTERIRAINVSICIKNLSTF